MGVRERRLSGLLAVLSMLSASTGDAPTLPPLPHHQPHIPLPSTGALGLSICCHQELGALL